MAVLLHVVARPAAKHDHQQSLSQPSAGAAAARRAQADLGAQLQPGARGKAQAQLLDQAGRRGRRRAGFPLPGESLQRRHRLQGTHHRERSRGQAGCTSSTSSSRSTSSSAAAIRTRMRRSIRSASPSTPRTTFTSLTPQAGKVFVLDSSGKYKRAIGSLKGGEGFFKRPTGIAVDSAAQKIYITDTLRNKIYVTDMQGSVLQTIGKPGTGDGEFNYPTELRLYNDRTCGGRRHELPRPGAGPLRRLQVLDRQTGRRRRLDIPSQRNWLRLRGTSLRRGWRLGHGAGFQPARTIALLLRPERATVPGTSSCRQDCRSTATTVSTSWIRINRRVQIFHYTAVGKQAAGVAR